jgi:hypothetical protein
MKKLSVVLFVLIGCCLRTPVSAAGMMLRITIRGGGLSQPIEITDRDQMKKFSIGGGPGSGCSPVTSPASQADTERSCSQSFIVDWSRGAIDAPAGGLVQYEVEFLMSRPNPKNTYRVSYAYDPVKRAGFVYIPGKDDTRYGENTWLINRGVEGSWYHAWSDWDAIATTLLKAAR